MNVTSVKEGQTTTFNLTNVPTSTKSVHEYTIDWNTLSQGEKGVTIKIDSDSDGIFERILSLGPTGEGEEGLSPWVWLAASALVAFLVALIVSLRFARKQSSES